MKNAHEKFILCFVILGTFFHITHQVKTVHTHASIDDLNLTYFLKLKLKQP